MEADPSVDLVGRKFGHYEILSRIGVGGMGVVWKARHTSLNTVVALKTMPPGFQNIPVLVERFRREAQVMARLRHPNIVQVTDFGDEEGTYYFVMEHVEGTDLSAHLKKSGPAGVDEAARIIDLIAAGVEAAHGQGVVHRDLKPSNVLMAADGTIKVTDFGLARIMEGVVITEGGQLRTASEAMQSLGNQDTDGGPDPYQLSAAGQILGTLEYMSPEQRAGEQVDTKTDVYALSVISFEMLIGRRPRGIEYPHELRKELSPAVTEVIHRGLGAPDRRPEGPVAFARELRKALARGAPVREGRRRSLILWAAGAAVLLIGVLAAVVFGPSGEPPEPVKAPPTREPVVTAKLLNVDVQPAGGGRVIVSPDPGALKSGDAVQLEATPSVGFRFVQWSDGSTGPALTVTAAEGLAVTAEFEIRTYPLTWDVVPERAGTVTGAGSGRTFEHGTVVTVTAQPNGGYLFDRWSDGELKATRRVTMTSGQALIARFKKRGYELLVNWNPPQAGTVEMDPPGPKFEFGQRVTLTAKPTEGFTFGAWQDDVNAAAVRTVQVRDAREYVARFRLQEYALTPSVAAGGSVAISPKQNSYVHGTQVMLTAEPDDGFVFAGWGDGLTGATRAFVVRTDRLPAARFTRALVNVTWSVSPREGGTVEMQPPGPQVAFGSNVTLRARPNPGYAFAGWKDGSRQAERVVTVSAGRAFVARFKAAPRALSGHTGTIWDVAFSSDGRFLASASRDLTVRLWDLKTDAFVGEFKGHKYGYATSVAFHPDGELIASGGLDKRIRIWRRDTFEEIRAVEPGGSVTAVMWVGDGNYLASGATNRLLQIWDLKDLEGPKRLIRPWTVLSRHGYEVNTIAFRPDGKQLITGSGDTGVRLFDVDWKKRSWGLGKMMTTPAHEDPGHGVLVAWTGDGALVVARAWERGQEGKLGKHPDRIAVWRAGRWEKTVRVITGHTRKITAVAAAPKGSLIVSASEDGTVRFWDAATGDPGRTLRAHAGTVRTVKFSPDGMWLATAGDDKTIRLTPVKP